jgi:hypothetical protein
MRIVAIALLAVIGSLSQPGKSPQGKSAAAQANELEQRAQSATEVGDQKARIAADTELFHLLNGSPAVLEALARAYAASGETQRALATLNRFADLGQTDEGLVAGTDRRFRTIQSLPQYKQLLARLSRNEAPISRSKVAFTLPDAGLLPEDIDYDARSRSFLVTSILERKIIRVQPDGSIADFAVSPDRWPMVAIKVDVSRNRVWATEVAFDGFTAAPRSAWGRSVLLCFDLDSGAILQRIDGPMRSSLADMVLTRQGELIVSDGDTGILYRVSNGGIAKMNDMDFISPQTPAVAQGGDTLFVPDYVRGIARLDPRTGHVLWLNREGVDKIAINGIDGLYMHHRSLIATQNGTSPERVIVFELDPALTHIISSKVIEQSAVTGGDPTHGVVVGDSFYYIANSGWARLDEHGNVKPGVRLTAGYIMRYRLS